MLVKVSGELLTWDIFAEQFEELKVRLGRVDFRLGRIECLFAVAIVAIVAVGCQASALARAAAAERMAASERHTEVIELLTGHSEGCFPHSTQEAKPCLPRVSHARHPPALTSRTTHRMAECLRLLLLARRVLLPGLPLGVPPPPAPPAPLVPGLPLRVPPPPSVPPSGHSAVELPCPAVSYSTGTACAVEATRRRFASCPRRHPLVPCVSCRIVHVAMS